MLNTARTSRSWYLESILTCTFRPVARHRHRHLTQNHIHDHAGFPKGTRISCLSDILVYRKTNTKTYRIPARACDFHSTSMASGSRMPVGDGDGQGRLMLLSISRVSYQWYGELRSNFTGVFFTISAILLVFPFTLILSRKCLSDPDPSPSLSSTPTPTPENTNIPDSNIPYESRYLEAQLQLTQYLTQPWDPNSYTETIMFFTYITEVVLSISGPQTDRYQIRMILWVMNSLTEMKPERMFSEESDVERLEDALVRAREGVWGVIRKAAKELSELQDGKGEDGRISLYKVASVLSEAIRGCLEVIEVLERVLPKDSVVADSTNKDYEVLSR